MSTNDIRMYEFEIYSEQAQLRRPLAWSLGLHVAFAAFVLLYATFIHGFRGEGWGSGGGGDAMGATLVSAVPLPANPAETTNVLATESKGLSKSEPKAQEKEPEAIPIPDKNAKNKTKPVPAHQTATLNPSRPSRTRFPMAKGARQRAVLDECRRRQRRIWIHRQRWRFRQPVRLVRASRAAKSHRKLAQVRSRPADLRGQAGLSDVRHRTRRTPGECRVEQSSGVPSLDLSAMRALERIDSFGPLPPDYSGSKVSVEFWFDYKR